MQNFAKSIIAIIMVLALVTLALLFGATEIIKGAFDRGPLVKEGDTSIITTGLGGSFEDISELSTQEFVFTDVGKFDQERLEVRGVDIPLTGKSFLATFDGVVKAGIDFSQISTTVDQGTRTVSLEVPRPTITEATIDPNTVTVYDQSMNPFNQFKVEDISKFLAVETDEARTKAIDRGLLDRAQERGGELLTEHVEATTKNTEFEDYSVNIVWK